MNIPALNSAPMQAMGGRAPVFAETAPVRRFLPASMNGVSDTDKADGQKPAPVPEGVSVSGSEALAVHLYMAGTREVTDETGETYTEEFEIDLKYYAERHWEGEAEFDENPLLTDDFNFFSDELWGEQLPSDINTEDLYWEAEFAYAFELTATGSEEDIAEFLGLDEVNTAALPAEGAPEVVPGNKQMPQKLTAVEPGMFSAEGFNMEESFIISEDGTVMYTGRAQWWEVYFDEKAEKAVEQKEKDEEIKEPQKSIYVQQMQDDALINVKKNNAVFA